ncbi:hypothetical protein GCM10008014_43760 [Paenibacillus silvae]|uniref:Uncharacterized protein n=1 Tax=Paenibacillus silvae TaxID=1325358 RepID=A0ABQ1ZGJ3_9BACL|nr:hypothetical protein GCM10008014_43760 [Paenibacillus silvae]
MNGRFMLFNVTVNVRKMESESSSFYTMSHGSAYFPNSLYNVFFAQHDIVVPNKLKSVTSV